MHSELVISATSDAKAVLDTMAADAFILAKRNLRREPLHATARAYHHLSFCLRN
jgi:hypothetical protein